MNTSKDPLVEYTVWGWYKFNGDKEGIANFLIIRDLDGSISNVINSNGNDPNFPICPFT